MPIDITKLTYEDIKKWILANFEDEELMDMLNRLTYAGTSKYKEQQLRGKN